MIRPIERVRYGIDWKDARWMPRESAEFVVTRAAKVEGHWRPARVISAPMSYDSAVAVFGQLVEENAQREHAAKVVPQS